MLRKDCNIILKNFETGVNNHRRNTYKKFQSHDYIIFLDTDLVFSNKIIQSVTDSLYQIKKDEWVVISPQTLRLWDDTWDCLVNDNFKCEMLNYYKKANIYKIHTQFINKNRNLKKLNLFKFAGGWFTVYSTKLLNFVGIPDSFGTYGPDDTFLMNCMYMMKKMD